MNIFHIAPLSLYDANELGFFFFNVCIKKIVFLPASFWNFVNVFRKGGMNKRVVQSRISPLDAAEYSKIEILENWSSRSPHLATTWLQCKSLGQL